MIADRAHFMPGDSEMHKLASQTGGRVIDAGNDPKKLRQAFDEIGTELRSQYMIGYIPATPPGRQIPQARSQSRRIRLQNSGPQGVLRLPRNSPPPTPLPFGA